MAFCPNCGSPVKKGNRFCTHCGTPLRPAEPAAPPANPNWSTDGARIIQQPGDPIFRVKCEYCCCTFEYRLRDLGYRAWYPSGFVYCPNCRKPIRHHLEFQVYP